MLEKESPKLWIRKPSALGQSHQNEDFVADYYGDKYQKGTEPVECRGHKNFRNAYRNLFGEA
jgi:hypothetical protein